MIATLDGDAHSIRHEMCHARYYLDPPYRTTVAQVRAKDVLGAGHVGVTGPGLGA